MAKKYQDTDIAEKIEVKKRKIKILFKKLPSDKAQFADGLIAQFAVTYGSFPSGTKQGLYSYGELLSIKNSL